MKTIIPLFAFASLFWTASADQETMLESFTVAPGQQKHPGTARLRQICHDKTVGRLRRGDEFQLVELSGYCADESVICPLGFLPIFTPPQNALRTISPCGRACP